MLFLAFASLATLYSLLLKGHIANTFVVLLDNFVYHDYGRALNVYSMYIRDYMGLFFIVLFLILFAIILRFYLNEFSKYFQEINRSIDALIEENTGDIVLPSELTVTEKKINYIKHTLEQRKLATELAEQRKNDLVVYLAHDLKTPLTSVLGYLKLIEDQPEITPELVHKYSGIARKKAQRLEELINEFFEVTRFSTHKLSLEQVQTHLSRMLMQITYEFNPILVEKGLEWDLQIAENVEIMCDADKLERAVDNLVRNAVSYSYPNTKIFFSMEQTSDSIRICIQNKGPAIPPEKLGRIFEQFYRLDAARSSGTGGAGLGLAIAKEIITLHGGKITAESENESTTFRISLPVTH